MIVQSSGQIARCDAMLVENAVLSVPSVSWMQYDHITDRVWLVRVTVSEE